MTDMRSLINIINTLTESRGLGARKAGEEFVSTSNPNDKIYVDSVTFYPQNGIEYPSYEEMVDEMQQIAHSVPNSTVDLIGKVRSTDRAFGMAVFDRPSGGKLAFIKSYKKLKPNPVENDWDNQKGIPGFKYNSKSAAKTQAGMTPQDILTAKQSNLTPADIVEQISIKFGADSSLTRFAKQIAAGTRLPITVPADPSMSFTAFRDYFCELMHPISLQRGTFKGNAQEAADKFLPNGGFASTSINFGNDKTEGLSDSILIAPNGQTIKVSSKGGTGAQASAKNLLDSAMELSESNPKLATKHKEVIKLIEDIVSGGQEGAPLKLGIRYDIISAQDAEAIKSFKKMPNTTMDAALKMKLSPKLKELIKARKTKKPNDLSLYYHSMAAVAHTVAKEVNENTNFSQAASEILNNAALVQVHSKISDKGSEWLVEEFNAKFPSDAIGGVKFSASKTYYSSGIKGNFTFKILNKGEKDVDDDINDIDDMAAEPSTKFKVKDVEKIKTHAVSGLRPIGAKKIAKEPSATRARR